MTLMTNIRTDVSGPKEEIEACRASREWAMAQMCFLEAYADRVKEKDTIEERIFAEACVITQAVQSLMNLSDSAFTGDEDKERIRVTLRAARQRTRNLKADMMIHEIMPLPERQLTAYENDLFQMMTECVNSAIQGIHKLVQTLTERERFLLSND